MVPHLNRAVTHRWFPESDDISQKVSRSFKFVTIGQTVCKNFIKTTQTMILPHLCLPNAGILLIGPLGTNFSGILIEILTFSFKKMRLEVSSAKRRPFCLGLNVLICSLAPGRYGCSHHGSLQWRHDERDGVSNHQPHDCLLNRLFRRTSKKTLNLRVTCDPWIPCTKGQ